MKAMEEFKTCSRCQCRLPLFRFPFTTARGFRYRRGWCRECLTAYYRGRAKTYKRVPKDRQFKNKPRLDLDKIDELFERIDRRLAGCVGA